MNIDALLASTIDGLMLGFIYGMTAMGLALIFGVMRVINLAHGPVITVGMFAVLLLEQNLGLNPYIALPLVMLLGVASGIAMYFIAVHRVIDAPELTTLLATYSVNLMIIGIGTVLFSTSPRALSVDLGGVRIGAVTVLGTRTVAVLIAALATAVLYYFLYRTRAGKSIRAVANNRAAAELMGINTTWALALSFGIGIALAMGSGSILATMFSFTILSGAVYEVKSFIIVVLGGLGNPLGALLGGIVIGLLEGIATISPLPVGWVPVIEFGVFVLILLIRPTGLFGAR